MQSFRTELQLPRDPFLALDRPILTLGSCFAEHIGARLLDYKWRGLNGPLGTLFHPLAISKLLALAAGASELDPGLFVERDAAFFHHDLHSRFYARSCDELQALWQSCAAQIREVLQAKPCVLLTLGTAWVYQLQAGGQVVANCHQQAGDRYGKRLLHAEEIQAALDLILELLPADSPLIISLSPVRHIRDTLIQNSLSKSQLLVHIHAFREKYPTRVRYFPAYEIMLDDLRDYRFYQQDMIHPTAEAVDYIWEKFIDCYAVDASRAFLKRWHPILRALKHSPQRPEAPSYQTYIRELLQKLLEFQGVDCSKEYAALKTRLIPDESL